ncbi:Asp-tRNA(Asn)/Glu-tRNA(Gln) amidotransferase subunit GatC [Ruficoccus amylovorans]|uniref:Aspartyl/glutamyl-tRNA(Asn/Gln) amidotransferase subunit C n=1 Tax=Ruficoccus amylovorans TaxID=1804625 RepID=A0A842H962_9BACT|nr:Asp-tRNA(Asn)/Glu-tRNA(Gln) amidotransferase subunit GatC [Ruficoccus amylovorans]MBC2593063.1 Asp-tRNA(Asn)/Glu-tRNA(Gln) amidotransferase subunit GatC [Ruficoccus amylovorans]
MPSEKIDIEYVARLARIDLTDEEKRTFTSQLEDILAYVDKLNQVDVSGVEPMAHAFSLENVLDDDEPGQPLPVEQALRNAPAQRDNQIVVPKVVEDA